jgi:peptidoglycan/LPS O-acetylase OafA/YrhL
MGALGREPRIVALDGLRAAAAGMVFLHHVQLPGLDVLTKGFDSGVLVFFALSGYLLYAPLAKASDEGRSVDLAGYAVRRVLRILPAYLVAAFLIAWLRYPWLLDDPLGLITSTHSSIVVVWTLQIEAMFYLAIPFAAFGLNRLQPGSRTRAIVAASMASILLTIVLMVASVSARGYVWAPDVTTLASFVWAFGAGMVVVEVQRRGDLDRSLSHRFALIGLALLLFSSLAQVPKFLDIGAAIGSALLIAYSVSRRQSMPSILARACVVTGALSYSVYLWHEAIIDALDRPLRSWTGAAAALAVTIVVASAVYLLVERPAIRLGARTSTRRPGPVAEHREPTGMPLAGADLPLDLSRA